MSGETSVWRSPPARLGAIASTGKMAPFARICDSAVEAMDGAEVVLSERIYHDAGAQTDRQMPYLGLVDLIRGAGKRAVERNSLYESVRETFDDVAPPREPGRRSLPVVHAA